MINNLKKKHHGKHQEAIGTQKRSIKDQHLERQKTLQLIDHHLKKKHHGKHQETIGTQKRTIKEQHLERQKTLQLIDHRLEKTSWKASGSNRHSKTKYQG
ncbi:MAG: hypothetical protein V7724_12470, partial [Sediminicola sp.]